MSSHSDDSSSAKPPRRLRPPTDDLPQIVGRAMETLNIGKAMAAARLELFRAPTAVRPMLASIRPRLLQLPAIAFPGPQGMIRASEILAKAG